MHRHRRDCLEICTGAGLTVLGVEERGRQWGVRCAEGLVICPSTPSDRRWRLNLRAQARRMARGL